MIKSNESDFKYSIITDNGEQHELRIFFIDSELNASGQDVANAITVTITHETNKALSGLTLGQECLIATERFGMPATFKGPFYIHNKTVQTTNGVEVTRLIAPHVENGARLDFKTNKLVKAA